MADVMRHRKEDAKPRYYPCDSAQTVAVGDMCFLNTDDARRASQFTWDTNTATTQRAFAKEFLGVSADRSRAADTDDIQVDAAGVKELICVAATFEIGDMVAPTKASGNNLEDQTIIAVTDKSLAIGRVAKRYGSNTTAVLIELFPLKLGPAKDVINEVYVQEHTVTTAEDTAGAVVLDTGWGTAIEGPIFVQAKNSSNAMVAAQDYVVTKPTGGDLGKISIADGSAQAMTATHVLSVQAHRYNS